MISIELACPRAAHPTRSVSCDEPCDAMARIKVALAHNSMIGSRMAVCCSGSLLWVELGWDGRARLSHAAAGALISAAAGDQHDGGRRVGAGLGRTLAMDAPVVRGQARLPVGARVSWPYSAAMYGGDKESSLPICRLRD